MSGNQQDEQEAFLTRWSRRKALARKGEALEEPAADADDAPLPPEAEAGQDIASPEQRELPGPHDEEGAATAEDAAELLSEALEECVANMQVVGHATSLQQVFDRQRELVESCAPQFAARAKRPGAR